MSTVNTAIDDFIKNNDTFNIDEVKLLVTQVLLGQEYNKNLYNKLVDKNFKLFKNKLINQIKNSKISTDSFNRLLDDKNKLSSLNDINNLINSNDDDTFSNLFKNLNKNNKYVSIILFIWDKYQDNEIISINTEQVKFIEKNFKGNFEEYLFFIMIRILKLNLNQLNKLYPKIELNNEENICISRSSSNETIKTNSDIDYDMDYLKILEVNINDLQNQVQNIYDNVLPKFNIMENDINEMKSLLESNNKTIFESINNIESKLDKLNEFEDFKNNLENHQKYTKNSINILEERFSRIFDIIKQIK